MCNCKIDLNKNWRFAPLFAEEMLRDDFESAGFLPVELPHTNKVLPFHYFNEADYQLISCYRKTLFAPKDWQGSLALLTFAGVGHVCEVYINGQKAGEHHCGYTAFTLDIAPYLQYGRENVITVKVDSRERSDTPPFGHVIDYLTYGGIYREVYLEIENPCGLSDVFVYTENTLTQSKTACAEISVRNAAEGLCLVCELQDAAGETLAKSEFAVQGACGVYRIAAPNAALWTPDAPILYTMRVTLYRDKACLAEKAVRFGFREAVFKPDGFYLNGQKHKLIGLNRHQSYPYVGYAMPKRAQMRDADILKYELGVNTVRTSHYPQSQHFINRCDEIGLLVFTELPGWQHIGDAAWQAQSVQNVADMIVQNRNHPSVILWGVRINESQDSDAFYEETNAKAHALDPTRQTGGVRCIAKSKLLEDVYTYNDFLHNGIADGLAPKKQITSADAPYLVTEYNGHMYPTKPFDDEPHRLQHAKRHARVLDAMFAADGTAGCIGWCMFDYNTHKDFGAGDGICYHGVMDMFRNAKPAAAVYASQSDSIGPVLQVSSSMDIGDHPASTIGEVYAFTNADSVCLYKNGVAVKEYTHANSPYPHLPHGPILINDFIGELLETNEGFSKKSAQYLKDVLYGVSKYGQNALPLPLKAKMLYLMTHDKMTIAKGTELYGKYIGNWGGEAAACSFVGIKDGVPIATVVKAPARLVKLCVDVDCTALCCTTSWDVASVRIRAVDQNDNLLPYYQGALTLCATGAVELIGPACITLAGGMGGTYVKTKGMAGAGALSIQTNDGEEQILHFTVSE